MPFPAHPTDLPDDGHDDEARHHVLTSLTLIKAQSQLVQRWVQQRSGEDTARILARLTSIDERVDEVSALINATRLLAPGDPFQEP